MSRNEVTKFLAISLEKPMYEIIFPHQWYLIEIQEWLAERKLFKAKWSGEWINEKGRFVITCPRTIPITFL